MMKHFVSSLFRIVCLLFLSTAIQAADFSKMEDTAVQTSWVFHLFEARIEKQALFVDNYVEPRSFLADDPCQVANLELRCEFPRQSTNLAQQNNNFDRSTYSTCSTPDFQYDGKDQVYIFTTPQGASWIEFELMGLESNGWNMTANLDLFIYSCDSNSCGCNGCIYSSTNLGNASELVRINNPSGIYYVIVDGYNAAQISNYVIWAYCDISDDPCFSNAQTINCNSPISASTLSSGNNYNNELYRDCLRTTDPYNGNDQIYRINTPQGANSLEFFLDGLTNDLDMFIYSCSGGGSCVGQNAKLGLASENVLINDPFGTYYIIIDGESSNIVGNFRLTVVCNGVNSSENPCNSVFDEIVCGQTYSENNAGSSAFFADVYSGCTVNSGFTYEGDDRLYKFSTPTGALSITIDMTGLTANLDMFLFSCNGTTASCIDESTVTGRGDESIVINNPSGDYYLIVDGVNSSQISNYSLTLDCELAISQNPCTGIANDLACGQSINTNNNAGGSNYYADLYEDCYTTTAIYNGNDRLFRFNTPNDAIAVTFDLTGLSANLDLFAYKCSGLGGCIAQSTRAGTGAESITINNPSGTYYLIVDASTANLKGNFRISATCEFNSDPCSIPGTNIIGCDQTLSGNNFTSNDNFDRTTYAACHSTTETYAARDRLYQLTIPTGVSAVEIQLTGLSANLDLFLVDCNGTATCVAKSTNTGNVNETISFDNPAGEYYIIIDGVNANQTSAYSLSVTCSSSDDPCATSPTVVNCGEPISGNNLSSGNNFNAEVYASCYTTTSPYNGNDQIYEVTTPQGVNSLSISLTGLSANLDLFVYDCSSQGTCIANSTNSGFTNESITIDNPVGTYYIIVDASTTNQLSGFTLSVDCCAADPLTQAWLQPFLDCTGASCGREIYSCSYQGQSVINIKDDPSRCTNGEGAVYNCYGDLLFVYGGSEGLNLDLAAQLTACTLIFNCPDEPIDGCDDCANCFFYTVGAINENTFSFFNNYCDVTGNGPALTYEWSFVDKLTGAAVAVNYWNETSVNSPHPVLDFPGPGTYEACIRVFQQPGFGQEFPVEVYACCQTLTVPETSCFDPPLAHFTIEYAIEGSLIYFHANSNENGNSFTWDIPAAAQPNTFPGGQVAYATFRPGDCYDVCLLVNNACGQSSYCQVICATEDCNEANNNVPKIKPQVDGQRVTFSDVPIGSNWYGFEWSIPSDASFVEGTTANTPSPVLDFPAPGRYNICLSFFNGCQKICWCWTVYIREICSNVEPLAGGIPLQATNVGASNAFSSADYDCYSGNSFFDAPDKIYEIIKPTNDGDLTISLLNDDLNGLPLDLDLFLLDNCSLPALCLAGSINAFGQPYLNKNFDAIYLPDFPAGTYYLVVDGYNDQQQGSFRLTTTTGNLACDAIPIECGITIAGRTQGAPNNVSAYSCQSNGRKGGYTGPELSFRYVATFEGLVNVKLTGLAPDVDLDVMILSDCDQNSACMGTGVNPAGQDEMINLQVSLGEDYYIVVDGWDGSVGDFILEIEDLSCQPPSSCDNICYYDYNGNGQDFYSGNFCNDFTYRFIGDSDYETLVYQLSNISGRSVCKWTVDGYDVPYSGLLDELIYTFTPGLHTICLYLQLPGQNCVTVCCRTIYVENPFDCGEVNINYEYVENQGFQFSLANQDPYQIVSWTREDTNTPLGTGPVSDFLVPTDNCETATISASYYDNFTDAWYVCSISVWLCKPSVCGESSIDYSFDGTTFVFDFAASNSVDQSSVIWIEEETGLEFGEGQVSQVSYPASLPCASRKICVEYYDYYTQSWHLCCRTIFLCDPFACAEINWEYIANQDAYQFSIPAIEDYTNISWEIESPVQAPLGQGYTSGLLKVATPCPTYVITVRYYDNSCNCWRVCSLTFNVCPPVPCCSNEPLTLSWLQPLLDCQQYTCGLQVFCSIYQGQAVIHLRDDPYQCSFITGRVYDCNGELLFNYGGTNGENLDLAAQLSNAQLIFECPGPSYEICNDGIDNDGDGLVDCEDPDCSFVIYPSATNADCGRNNGTATVYLYDDIIYRSGSFSPPTYLWSNGGTSQTIEGLSPGIYSVTVTNENGCESIGTVEVGENNNLAIIAKADATTICEGDTTVIRTISLGGKPPFTYTWSDGLGSGPTVLAYPVVTTIYGVTLTDANGCQATDTVLINVNPKPTITIVSVDCAPDLLTYNIQLNTEIGNDVDVSQGILSAGSDGNYTISNVPVGQEVLISVVNPNSTCANETLVPSPDCPCPDIPLPISDGDLAICQGDALPTLSVSVADGLTADWYDAPIGGQLLAATTTSFIPPGAGIYYAEAIDPINNCVSSRRAPVGLTINPLPIVTIVGDTILCAGEESLLTATGADEFLWNTGETTASIIVNQSGTYFVEGTDANGCKQTASINVLVTDPIIGTFDVIDVSCNGGQDGSVFLDVTGGTPPYRYQWENGADAPFRSDLIPGIYFVTVTDFYDCIWEESVTVTEPTPIELLTTFTHPDCANASNGTISVIPTGGTPPYFYDWTDDPNITIGERTGLGEGIYTVTVIDDNGCFITETVILENRQTLQLELIPFDAACNGGTDGRIEAVALGGTRPYAYLWSNQSTDSILTDIPANITFTVTVTDALGCSIVGESSVGEPTLLVLEVSHTDVNCFGEDTGTALVSATGGTPPYQYLWSNLEETPAISNLSVGKYFLTVTDANDCIQVDSVEVFQPDSLSASSTVTDATSCSSAPDGAIDLTVTGGTGAYSFLWSTGATSEDLSGLSGGNYSVVITDENGCETTHDVVVNEPSSIAVETLINPVTCQGGSDGSLELIITGGLLPYDIQWADGATTALRENLVAGTYAVTITDANGCTFTASPEVTEPEALTLASTLSDISCFGANDGSISIVTSGGTPPYTFSWSNGATTESISDLAAGDYSLVVTDANDCVLQSETFTINEPNPLEASSTVTDATSCSSAPDGAIDLTVTGGTGTYSFLWSTGATSEDLSGLSGGNYSVVITDENGCETTHDVVVNEPSSIAVETLINPVTCQGGSDGSLELIITGGLLPYDIQWADGATTALRENLVAGTYAVTITDANGCTFTASPEVTEPEALTLASTLSDISCFGANDGSISIVTSGGTPPYTFSWSNGATTESISDLAAGDYSLVVTDANDCVLQSETFTINEPNPLEASSEVTDATSCSSAPDGAIDLTVTGGTGTYSFLWSTGATSEDLSGLSGGNYSVVITDENGCETTHDVVVNEPSSIGLETIINPVTCQGGSDGSLELIITGGLLPYNIQWADGATTALRENLVAGTYAVTITDANGCTFTASPEVTEPEALTLASTLSDISCFGANDGSISIVTSGGTPPYTFSWSNGATTESISDLAAGEYSLVVTDANDCVLQSETFTINEPNPLEASSEVTDATSCSSAPDGAIDLTVTGGTGAYSFLWSTGATSEDLSGLSGGNYSVVITDENGCETTHNVVVNEPSSIAVETLINPVTCQGGSDGSLELIITGGLLPYDIQWADGATTALRENLVAGTYAVTITDANGCTFTASPEVTEPEALTLASTLSDISCFGANDSSISIVTSGGTPPYSFSWSNGATTESISDLAAGDYSLVVTDANDCVLQSETFTINEPNPLEASATVTDATSCSSAPDGAIDLTVTGGTGTYSFLWSTGATSEDLSGLSGGNYSVVITDENGCETTHEVVVNEPSSIAVETLINPVTCQGGSDGSLELIITGGLLPYDIQWADGATTALRENLVAGTYAVTITDANGCTFTASPEVTEPEALTLASTLSDISCFGANDSSISIVTSGGTPPYSFSWSNGATTESISDLAAGDYSLVVTDANDCVLQSETFTINEPNPLEASATVTDATSCSSAPDGAIDLTVTGGTGTYSFLWSTGATSEDLSGLSGGNYSVVITDENGCETTHEVVVNEPSSIAVETLINPVTCQGGSDGSLELIITGGLLPYDIQWADGATTALRENLVAGTYAVTITDANGCSFTASPAVTEPDEVILSPTITGISCFGEEDGVIELAINGGTPPYTFNWSNGATTPQISGLAAGDYSLTLTDANDCIIESDPFTIEPKAAIQIQAVIFDATPCGATSDGALNITVSGGTPGYTFAWSNGAVSEDISGLPPGIYTVTVTDNNGCQATLTRTVNQAAILRVETLVTNVSCGDDSNGRIELVITGGIAPYDIIWENQQTTTVRTDLPVGIYTYTVADANNCIISGEVAITALPALFLDVNLIPVSCFGENDGGIQVIANGGTRPYRFAWSTGSDTPVLNALKAGEYGLTVTDKNLCTFDTVFVLSEPEELAIIDTQITDAACSGIANGSIVLTVSGGDGPYAFAWSNGSTLPETGNVLAGDYTVTITDANNCSITSTLTIENVETISLEAVAFPAICDEDNGRVELDISGGTVPYTIDWNNDGTGDNDDEQNPTGLAPGTYSVIVSDANGCSATLESVIIEGKSKPTINILTITPTICGETNGSVEIEVIGGEQPFSFQWSNNTTSQNLTGVTEGDYTLEVSDANNCQVSVNVTISCFNPCEVSVGTMGTEKLMGCQSEVLEATYDATGEVVGAGNLRLFVVHNGSGNSLGDKVFNVSADPRVTFQSSMSPGAEYYISAVVGKDNGNGLIDFNHSCLVVAPGTPFSFAPAPNGPAQLIATNSTLCPGEILELTVAVLLEGDINYIWETPKGIITTSVPKLTVGSFSSLDQGEYLVSYQISGCESAQLGPLVIQLDDKAKDVSAGEEFLLCGSNSLILDGKLPQGATGQWFTTSPAVIDDPTDPNTRVDSFINGYNTFVWVVNTGACVIRDTINIYHAVTPTSQDREITMEANQATLLLNTKALFDAIALTIPDSQLVFSVVEQPEFGQLTPNENSLTYQRDLDKEEDLEISFTYKVCNDDPMCGELCSESDITLKIKYLETEIIDYKKALRPGGENPIWEFTLLRNLSKARLTIVDRWGQLIFKKDFDESQFDLSKGNEIEGWAGQNMKGVNMYTGAYYFIFEGTPSDKDNAIIEKGIIYLLK
ncbi:MAG: pre-peptidase C-terminal domain-containing protein [Saprospiraceae bacterium]